MRKVILILGEDNVETYFDVMVSDKSKLTSLHDNIDISEFDSELEEEAFRMGLCKVNGKNTRDFCEITESNLKQLKKRIEGAKSRK